LIDGRIGSERSLRKDLIFLISSQEFLLVIIISFSLIIHASRVVYTVEHIF